MGIQKKKESSTTIKLSANFYFLPELIQKKMKYGHLDISHRLPFSQLKQKKGRSTNIKMSATFYFLPELIQKKMKYGHSDISHRLPFSQLIQKKKESSTNIKGTCILKNI